MKHFALLELTLPWEDAWKNYLRGRNGKYQELVEECRRQGWRAQCHPVEEGCRGLLDPLSTEPMLYPAGHERAIEENSHQGCNRSSRESFWMAVDK